MIIVQYDKKGTAINDFEAYDFVKNTIDESKEKEEDINIHISTQVIVWLFLRAIEDGYLDSKLLKIYQDVETDNLLEIRFDENGSLYDRMIEPEVTDYDIACGTGKIFND